MASAHQPVDDPHRRPDSPRRPASLRWRLPLLHLLLGLAWIGALAWLVPVILGEGAVPWWLPGVGAVLATTLVVAVWANRPARIAVHSSAITSTPHAMTVEGTHGVGIHALIQQLPDGVLLLVEGQVAYANAAAEAALGHAPGAMTGMSADALVAAAERPAFGAWLQALASHGSAPSSGLRLQRADGSGFHAALSAARARQAGGSSTLLVVRDSGEAERMRDELAAGNRELQALAARVFTLQEDERRAISRELHDDIGQSVTAMKMAAASALDEADVQRRRDDLEDILMLADATLERLRDISILLRPPQLDALGLEAALRWHAQRRLHDADIASNLDIDTLPRRPEAEVEQACFRIAQEALTNVMRHARASRVMLRLHADGPGLRLCIDDDGVGFAPDVARGLGLVIMRERALGVGGRLEVHAAHGGGTRIEAWLPYASAGAAQGVAPATTSVPASDG